MTIYVVCALSFYFVASQDCSHHSQDGESEAVFEMFFKHPEPKRNGVFLEIGGFDGVVFSNTLFFENCLGWTGVLIEGSPMNFNKLRHNRKSTHNLHMAACEYERMIDFTVDGSPVSGSMQQMPTSFLRQYHGGTEPKTTSVYCGPLSHQLCLLGITNIDFMSIDVEGAELEVVKSIDFSRVDVSVIIVEADTHSPEKNSAVRSLLVARGFNLTTDLIKRSDLFVNTFTTRASQIAHPCKLPPRFIV